MTGQARDRSGLRRAAVWLVALAFLAGAAFWLHHYLGQKPAKTRPAVQQITLIKPPPPPPPPPPKVEPKPPEPPKPREEVKLDQPKPDPTPQPKSEQPPPSDQLGVDAKGSGAGDGFGIVGNPGGRSITESAPAGGGGGPVIGGAPKPDYSAHIARLQRQIEDALARNDRLRAVPYRVAIRITFHPDGTFRGIALDDSTGDPSADAELRTALASIALATDPASPRMPREARIRITNRI